MNKFVITYELDCGDNAECMLVVHCVEYESIKKLKEDFAEYVRENIWDLSLPFEQRVDKRRNSSALMFCGNRYHWNDFADVKWKNYKDSPDGYPTAEFESIEYHLPVILPLDEWFEFQKQNKLGS